MSDIATQKSPGTPVPHFNYDGGFPVQRVPNSFAEPQTVEAAFLDFGIPAVKVPLFFPDRLWLASGGSQRLGFHGRWDNQFNLDVALPMQQVRDLRMFSVISSSDRPCVNTLESSSALATYHPSSRSTMT